MNTTNDDQFLSEDEQLAVIEPIWPQITTEEATQALTAFSKISEDSTVTIVKDAQRIITSGAIVQVTTSEADVPKKYFLKRFHISVMTPKQLQPKHKAANQYAKNLHSQISAPRIATYIETPDGQTTVIIGEWIYELSSIAEGEDRYEKYHSWQPPQTSVEAFSIGQALAFLHNAASCSNQPADPGPSYYDNRYELIPNFVIEESTALHYFLDKRPVTKKWIENNAPNLKEDLKSCIPPSLNPDIAREIQKLPHIWIHGDGHCSNMTFHQKEVHTIFDFGLASPAPAVMDLAIALERNTLEWVKITAGDLASYRLDIAKAIMDGYQSVRPLNQSEKKALPAIIASVHVEAALNLIGYHIIANLPNNAQWSYDTYFRFHSTWFNTQAGKEYLAGIKRSL
ncbi:MAG: phosphotransferase [Actinomycetaceae bacterium]|nr:phosphotransferase [Actinomycetaceae bacterium]